MSLASLPLGRCVIVPVDAPRDYSLSTGPSSLLPNPELPVTVDKISEIWQVIPGDDGSFRLLLARPSPYQYKWVNKDNVLFVRWPGLGDNFRIEAVGPNVWVIAIPHKDLYLTFNGLNVYPYLTFEPANGTSAQQFYFKYPI